MNSESRKDKDQLVKADISLSIFGSSEQALDAFDEMIERMHVAGFHVTVSNKEILE